MHFVVLAQIPNFLHSTFHLDQKSSRKSIHENMILSNKLLRFFEYSRHLFCDGCGGQSKCSRIIHKLYFWLRSKSPHDVTKSRIALSVRRHYFMPIDRVYGKVKKIIEKTPTKHEEIYSQIGKVKRLGDKCIKYLTLNVWNVT